MLKVTTIKVYNVTCMACDADLGNPVDGSLNWDSATSYGATVTCPACNITHNLPKKLR